MVAVAGSTGISSINVRRVNLDSDTLNVELADFPEDLYNDFKSWDRSLNDLELNQVTVTLEAESASKPLAKQKWTLEIKEKPSPQQDPSLIAKRRIPISSKFFMSFENYIYNQRKYLRMHIKPERELTPDKKKGGPKLYDYLISRAGVRKKDILV